MVKQTEKGHFMIIRERKDDKFAEAVDEALNSGWEIVNALRMGYNEDHVGYLIRK